MPTPQEQYDEAKVRLDNNIKRLELLNTEIQQKEQENQEAIKIVQEIVFILEFQVNLLRREN